MTIAAAPSPTVSPCIVCAMPVLLPQWAVGRIAADRVTCPAHTSRPNPAMHIQRVAEQQLRDVNARVRAAYGDAVRHVDGTAADSYLAARLDEPRPNPDCGVVLRRAFETFTAGRTAVVVLHGITGCGKTRAAFSLFNAVLAVEGSKLPSPFVTSESALFPGQFFDAPAAAMKLPDADMYLIDDVGSAGSLAGHPDPRVAAWQTLLQRMSAVPARRLVVLTTNLHVVGPAGAGGDGWAVQAAGSLVDWIGAPALSRLRGLSSIGSSVELLTASPGPQDFRPWQATARRRSAR